MSANPINFILIRWDLYGKRQFPEKREILHRQEEGRVVVDINIKSSYDSFRELRESNSYYIDKTEMLEEYLVKRFEKAVLFARPRRFGKSLTMTMFRDFLDIRQSSRDIFNGLKIMEHPEVVAQYMNQFPVLFISLKEVFGRDFESVLQNFKIAISVLCDQHAYLADSPRVSQVSKKYFNQLWNQEAKQENTEQSLALLCQMLHDHYEKPAFVIIDEYDVPMSKAYGKPEYDLVRDMIEHMLSYVCKTNSNVKAVILSGCLYTVKNSAYTGVNNINPYTILSPQYASSIGFTDENVRTLLRDAGHSELYETVEEWYDGYLFGREKMYCPWDVLLFVRSVLDGSYSALMGPESYWVNTSETAQNLIHGFLGRTPGAQERFEQLLAGNSVDCRINEFVPYHQIHTNGDNLWSALLETGYLTKAIREKAPVMPLRIPNREIQAVFRQEVWEYFENRVDNIYVENLVDALWAEDVVHAEASLNQILEATLSFYHKYHEYSYHLILDGFFTGKGYLVQSELETGYGRSDLIIQDSNRMRCMILELKHVKTQDEMESALRDAASQIIQKKYDSRLIYEGYTTRVRYAMAFYDQQGKIAIV